MHELEPADGVGVVRLLGQAEDRVPARREVDPVGDQVPVPDAVVGGAHRQGVALLAAGEAWIARWWLIA